MPWVVRLCSYVHPCQIIESKFCYISFWRFLSPELDRFKPWKLSFGIVSPPHWPTLNHLLKSERKEDKAHEETHGHLWINHLQYPSSQYPSISYNFQSGNHRQPQPKFCADLWNPGWGLAWAALLMHSTLGWGLCDCAVVICCFCGDSMVLLNCYCWWAPGLRQPMTVKKSTSEAPCYRPAAP